MASGVVHCVYQFLHRDEQGRSGLRQCGQPAIVLRNGRPHCKRHDPEAVRVKSAGKPDLDVDVVAGQRQASCWEACRSVTDEQIAGIAAAGGLAAMLRMIAVLAAPKEWVDRVKATQALIDIAEGRRPHDPPSRKISSP